jgi:hypothetical protein
LVTRIANPSTNGTICAAATTVVGPFLWGMVLASDPEMMDGSKLVHDGAP